LDDTVCGFGPDPDAEAVETSAQARTNPRRQQKECAVQTKGLTKIGAMLAALAVAAAPGLAAAESPSTDSSHRARVVAEQWVGPRLLDLTVESPALARTGQVRLLTPDGWEHRRPGQRWPVFYLLHGCCDTYDSWTRETALEEFAELRDVLVVMPEGGEVGFYSDWWNYGAGGPPGWETFHLRELPTLLERGYGAGTKRVVAGLSMGGFGSLSYAARHPGFFRAAASYSGLGHPLFDPEGLMGLLEAFGEDPLALWGDPVEQRRIWEAHDPYYLAHRLRDTPVFLSSGNGEAGPFDPPGEFDPIEAFILDLNTTLAARLRERKVPLTTDFYGPGTHTWPYWERELRRSLPLLLDALEARHTTAGIG
jgi:diacylglycerol O-acyltransferase/trehalose O-mycolyltransferase